MTIFNYLILYLYCSFGQYLAPVWFLRLRITSLEKMTVFVWWQTPEGEGVLCRSRLADLSYVQILICRVCTESISPAKTSPVLCGGHVPPTCLPQTDAFCLGLFLWGQAESRYRRWDACSVWLDIYYIFAIKDTEQLYYSALFTL